MHRCHRGRHPRGEKTRAVVRAMSRSWWLPGRSRLAAQACSRVSSGSSWTAAARESFSACSRSTCASRSETRCRRPAVLREERVDGHGGRCCSWCRGAPWPWVCPSLVDEGTPRDPAGLQPGRCVGVSSPESHADPVPVNARVRLAAHGSVHSRIPSCRRRSAAGCRHQRDDRVPEPVFGCGGCGSEWVVSRAVDAGRLDRASCPSAVQRERDLHPRSRLTARAEVRRAVHEGDPHGSACRSARTARPPGRRRAASGRSSRDSPLTLT